ncbi:GRP family sugar transporter [Sinomicrobium weinanense]|uniref:Multidrug DMT transporter permease n=1 Tax=Sinomicrobium weinanense TaxID=2842200 RepID=A0A926Q387_9FLAO|nr:GRP family sugar transporter [Sinomicrobium weinanense]MBC9795746.1 multidrug DMT transporter permease [Sinomicrobium weinanense]
MFIVENYLTAVIFCFITMLCWGSWANTQKLVQKTWRFELFYWDYVIGIFLFSLAAALTLGSFGSEGRPFIEDLRQAKTSNMLSAIAGGVVFNLANILLTAAIAGAGMAVAFPIGIGIALVLGVVLNYFLMDKGDPVLLFMGVLFVTLAIILNAVAYRRSSPKQQSSGSKWIIVSVIAGVLMSMFYGFVASSMDLENFKEPTAGMMTPYTAVVVFSVGILLSNVVFNSILLKRPLEGKPIAYSQYFKGKIRWHSIGVLGGCIWALGNVFNLIAAGKAGPAISYGLGQGATLIAALWGVLIWKEFKNSPKSVTGLIVAMFCCFIIGLGLIIYSGGS